MDIKKISKTKIILNFIFFFLAAVWWLPIIWTLIVSVKPLGTVVYDIKTWLVPPFSLDNFKYVFTNSQSNMPLWLFNSFFVASMETLGVLALSVLAAFSFSRFHYPGQKILFWIIMAGMMIPFQSLLIPIYLLFKNVGLLNTYWSLILPGLGSSFGVLLLKQFMDGIPEALFDAAKIDGCKSWHVLSHIIAPLTRPALASLVIFIFLQKWNDFLWPFIAITKPKFMTVPIGIVFFRGQYSLDIAYSMAANAVAAIPVLIIFFIFEKQIVKGIAFSGIKD
jgi:multiple sugar transport system permease protein